MAFADSTTYFDTGDESICGCFEEKEHGHLFEFSKNPVVSGNSEEYPHLVWVNSRDPETRYAKVLKTVAYIVVDENENGLVIEKWFIKNHRKYTNPNAVKTWENMRK